MKILMINSLDIRYGSTYRARNLYAAFLKFDSEVTYMEPNYQGEDKNVISVKQADNLWGYFNVILSAIKECLFSAYDVLLLLKTLPLSLPCVFIARLRRKKVVIDIDDLDSELQVTFFRKKLISFLENMVPKYADMVTTHSDYIMDFIKQKNIKRILKIPQGADVDLFDPRRYDRQLLREKIGLSNKKVLVYLATLTWGGSRDLDIILEAVRNAARDKQDLFLMIVGGGNLEGHFLQLITKLKMNDKVMITGLLGQEQIPAYLAVADIFLIFMRDDLGNRMRSSLKLLEYLAMEKTVVGHVVGESKDHFGQYCLLCEANIESFTARILEAYEGKAQRQSARAYIKSNYSWHESGKKMIEALKIGDRSTA